jgi:hypothetical protein
VLQASFRLAGIIAIGGYVFDPGVSRLFLGFTFVMATPLLLVSRWMARRSLHKARLRGLGWTHRVLVVGDVAHVMELVGQLRREAWTDIGWWAPASRMCSSHRKRSAWAMYRWSDRSAASWKRPRPLRRTRSPSPPPPN